MEPVYKGWIWAVLIGLDQLGNAICGGHPDITVSARLHHLYAREVLWAAGLHRIVDWAFAPVDGPKHCYQSYCREVCAILEDEEYRQYQKVRRGNDVGLFFLTLGVAGLALPLRAVNQIRAWTR